MSNLALPISDGPMGNSGHNGCDIWMIRPLYNLP
jgi:hypothetical protein